MIKKIAPDKWKHFYVGIAMGIVLQVFLWHLLIMHPLLATIAALIMVMAISYGFELFSLFTGRGHYDIMDAVAGTIGGILGMAIALVFQLHLLG